MEELQMTEVELSSLLSDLKESSQKLNDESGAMNSTIISIESQLVQANTGVEHWLGTDDILETRDEDGNRDHAVLGFAKIDGQWGLFVRRYGSGGDVVPLIQASREVRIAALAKMPTLVKMLSDEVNRKLKAIEDAKLLVK
jgi:hypothetical protein